MDNLKRVSGEAANEGIVSPEELRDAEEVIRRAETQTAETLVTEGVPSSVSEDLNEARRRIPNEPSGPLTGDRHVNGAVVAVPEVSENDRPADDFRDVLSALTNSTGATEGAKKLLRKALELGDHPEK